MRYKIVISDYSYKNLSIELNEFAKLERYELIDCTKITPGGIKDPRELIRYAEDCDALIHQFAQIDAKLINQLKKCKVIARYAIGVDTIDVAVAQRKGIFIVNCPDYCINEVADTAAGHLINAMRKHTLARDLLLAGVYDIDEIRPIQRMEESTLCLIGFGRIARNLYSKIHLFFKYIVVYDPFFDKISEYPDILFLKLNEALSMADAISVHVPLTPETRGLISSEQFSLMKDGVVLVNTSRGAVIDEKALLLALGNGKVGYCGLDVLCAEDYEHSQFLHHPRAMLTPHIGWCSEQAQAELQLRIARNVVQTLLLGKPFDSYKNSY